MGTVSERTAGEERAQGMVEFALILPFLLLLILGVIEVGRLLFIYSAVTTASREAARYGSAAGDIGGYVAHYQDCSGMRSAARRMGVLVGIQDSSIAIHYDNGDNASAFGNCPVGSTGPAEVHLRDRVVVQVSATYQPLFTLLSLPGNNSTGFRPFPITSISRRTILKDVILVGTPPAGEAPKVSFAIDGQSALESAGVLSVVVRLSSASPQDVIVSYGVGGTATGADFSITPSDQIVIPHGSTSAVISVAITDDPLDEEDEFIVITMGSPVNAIKSAPSIHTIRIIDDDEPPTVSFTVPAQSHSESTGSIVATAKLSSPSGKPITLPFSVSGTATNGTDYTITASPIVIPPGSASGDIFITIEPDTLDEDDESVIVTLGPPTNATLVSPSEHSAWIIDDDEPPSVSFTWASQDVTETAGSVSVQIKLSAASGKEITVPIQVGGTAANGSDYGIASAFPVVILPGNATAALTVNIYQDILEEDPETIILSMGQPINATLGSPNVHTLNITNVVPLPLVSFTSSEQTKSEDGVSMEVTARLSAASLLKVTVPFSLSGTATLGMDYSVQPVGGITIPAGASSASITLTIIDDVLDEENETVIVTMGTPINAVLGTPSVHTAIIIDNDSSVVSFSTASQAKREDAGSMTVGLQLSNPSTIDISVPFSLSGTAASGVDYTITPSPVILPAGSLGAAITINLLDDTVHEEDETVVVTLGAPANASLGTPSVHTATIIDNDDPVCMIFDGNELNVDSSSRIVSWTISNLGLDKLVLQSLTINWPDDGRDAPKFSAVKFGSTQIWSGNLPQSPQTVTSWQGFSNDRTLTSAATSIGLGFSRTLLAGSYTLTLQFRNLNLGIDCPTISRSYILSAP